MAPNAGKVKLLRCVVREDLSMGMVDNLVADIRRIVDQLDKIFVFTDKEVGPPVSFNNSRTASSPNLCCRVSIGTMANEVDLLSDLILQII